MAADIPDFAKYVKLSLETACEEAVEMTATAAAPQLRGVFNFRSWPEMDLYSL